MSARNATHRANDWSPPAIPRAPGIAGRIGPISGIDNPQPKPTNQESPISIPEIAARQLGGSSQRAGAREGGALLSLIGNTPLVGFERVTAALGQGAEVYAKAEWYNPGGSVKDRAARAMVLDGFASGLLREDKTLIDATSGNTGIAYAMLGAALGFKVKLALPRNASRERKQILAAFGADLLLTDPGEGTDGAQRLVKKIVAESPTEYFYPDQYNNNANWRAHYETTAEEIWRQTNGRVTHFVAALGTSGTFVGTTRRLKELNPNIKCVAVQPDSPLHGLEGVKHMETALVPGIWDASLADETLLIETEAAHQMVLRLAQEEGLMVGPSAGANLVAAKRVARAALAQGQKDIVVVTIFCDSAARYLSDSFWTETQVTPESGSAEVWP